MSIAKSRSSGAISSAKRFQDHVSRSSKFMTEIYSTGNTMAPNAPRPIKGLLETIAITAICCMSASPGNAQIVVRSEESIIGLPQFTRPSTQIVLELAPETMPPTEVKTPEATPEAAPELAPEGPPGQNSYIGLGGVIGLQGGTTSLSQGTFSIVSKQVLTRNLAIHTADTIFGSSTASSSYALTYNHPIRDKNLPIVYIPFLGGGVMLHDENGLKVSPLVTAGIDIDTPTNVTGTVRINSGFVSGRKADVGVIFGVGYNY
jgi:hypothetical protein